MATYAGFKPYEVPSLGDIMAKGIDKRAMLDYKESVLKAKQDASDLKEQRRITEKDEAEKKKKAGQIESTVTGITKDIEESKAKLDIDNSKTATSITGIATQLGSQIRDQGLEFTKTEEFRNWPSSEQVSWGIKTTGAMNSLDGLVTSMNSALENVQKTESPYSKYAVKLAASLVPNDNNPVVPSIENGRVYVQRTRNEMEDSIPSDLKKYGLEYPEGAEKLYLSGGKIDLSYIHTAKDLSALKPIDFDKDVEEGVLAVGKQEVGSGSVNQAGSSSFKTAVKNYGEKITYADPQKLTEAVNFFCQSAGKDVVMVDENASEKEIYNACKQDTGKDPKDVFILKMKLKGTELKPVLTDKQKDELKGYVDKYCTARAERKIQAPKEGKQPTDVDELVDAVVAGDKGAMEKFSKIAQQKGTIMETLDFPNGFDYKNGVFTLNQKTNTTVSQGGSATPSYSPSSYPLNRSDKNLKTMLKSMIK